ncbi:MAG: hypothetical protein IJ809_00915 [Clostridia bacterium]|nr:hypothetical protein [Clostridia bacterium]
MKKINEREMKKYLPKIIKLVEENPVWAGSLSVLRQIYMICRTRKEDITVEEFNNLILRIPYSDILMYRQHGLDFPRSGFNETLED